MIHEQTIQQWEAEAKERTKWNIVGQHPENELRILALIKAYRESQARGEELERKFCVPECRHGGSRAEYCWTCVKSELQATKEMIAKLHEVVAKKDNGLKDLSKHINSTMGIVAAFEKTMLIPPREEHYWPIFITKPSILISEALALKLDSPTEEKP